MATEKHLLANDPEKGITQYYHFDDLTGDITLETEWVTTLDEVNPDAYNAHSDYQPWRGDMHHVASIPDVIVHDLMKRGIWQDNKKLLKWLDDPDNRLWRTKPGRLAK
jgi:hypothetical protein